jgi:hypothetical protein
LRSVTPTSQALLLEIARCPVIEECITGEGDEHPCAGVVLHQWPGVGRKERLARWKREHHVPEPWVGHIELAPILFLSSNPSLSSLRPPTAPVDMRPRVLERLRDHDVRDHPSLRRAFEAPKWEWEDDELCDRFDAAFEVWTDEGTRPLMNDAGEAGPVAPFWRAVKEQAEAVLDQPAVPGSDYALTEIVHCKSRDEVGVVSATRECLPRYLRRVLALSPAALIIVYGAKARNAVRSEFDYPDAGVLSRPLDIEGVTRCVVFLAHPNSRQSKYPKRLPDAELEAAQLWLGQRSAE